MTRTIAFFIGRFRSFNVRQTLKNFGKMLGSRFELHLITVYPEKFIGAGFEPFVVHGTSERQDRVGEFLALKRYLEMHNPDVLTQIGSVPVYGNMISLLSRPEITFVCRYSGDLFYEYTLESGFEKLKYFGLKNVFGRLPLYVADQFIAMGPREKMRLVKRGVDPESVDILPPPIDPARFEDVEPVDGIEVPSSRSVVLFVGRVSRLKGAETLERTIPEILDRRKDLHFVLVGTPSYQFDLPRRYMEHVSIVGEVPPTAVPSYFRMADLYVHPSLTEGISRSVLEAIACETTVVVRDVGDLAYATTNFFTTDDDFVDMVCDFESLNRDSPDRFTVDTLAAKYVSTFEHA